MLEQKSGEFSYETPSGHPHHSHPHHDSHASQIKISLDDSALDGYRDAPESYPSLKRAHSQSNLSRRSFGSYDDLFSDPRLQRLQQAEASIRREMFKECTFRPAIKNLPTQYGPLKETGTPFVTRYNEYSAGIHIHIHIYHMSIHTHNIANTPCTFMSRNGTPYSLSTYIHMHEHTTLRTHKCRMDKWKKEREQQVQVKKRLSQKSAEDACTFKPRINRLSDRAVQQIRGDSPQAAHERLFRVSVSLHENRRKILEEESEREAAERLRDCPFAPTLATRDAYAHVQPKVMRPAQSKG
ncbi:hypothetical protein EON64_16350, partial [archaeon]